jgi:uncharacterized DUF497 family protein
MTQGITGFDWDEGNWPKCAKHGVSKTDIEHVFTNEPMVRPNRTRNAEPRFNAIGLGATGRYLFIAFTIRNVEGQTRIRPISARYMHRKEIEHYEQSKDA